MKVCMLDDAEFSEEDLISRRHHPYMMTRYYLAIDIGASSGRHILAHIEKEKLVLEEIYRFENGFEEHNGSFVWNIDHLEAEVKAGIKKCKELGKIPVSVAIDTWGVDYALLDGNKKVIKPVFSYRDNRTNKVKNEIPFEKLYSKTGIQNMYFNTVYQLLCDKKSGKLDKARYFLMMPDYLSFTLTGVMKNEYTNATTTGMVNAITHEWDITIVDILGNRELFKPLSVPTAYVGDFTKEMQEYCGFNAKVVLCPTHDTASAVAGIPMNDNSLYISSGTWSLIGTEIKTPILTDKSRELNFSNEGGIDYRFRYLKNYMGMWLFQNIRKNLDKKYTYDQMMQMAMTSAYIDYFDVNDESLIAPENMLTAINKLIGALPLADTLNCVYHSLAMSYKNAVSEIEHITGKAINSIFIVGGGSKDSFLNSLTAKYTGKRVYVGLSEATATGNLITQIMADSGIDLAIARKLVFNSFDITEVHNGQI